MATAIQDDYAATLSEKIKSIQDFARSFKDLAQNCSYQAQQNTQELAERIQLQGEMHHRELISHMEGSRSEASLWHSEKTYMFQVENERHEQDQAAWQQLAKQIKNAQDTSNVSMEKSLSRMKRVETEMKKIRKRIGRSDSRVVRPSSYGTYVDGTHRLGLVSVVAGHSSASAQEGSLLNFQKALTVLAHDYHESSSHLEASSRQTLSLSSQSVVVAIMESRKLHEWLGCSQASALLINGNETDGAGDSPMSYVCGKLLNSISNRSKGVQPGFARILSPVFFCHQSTGTELWPKLMMKSLITQLVITLGWSSVRSLKQYPDINTLEMRQLCDIFRMLIDELPTTFSVFCVIDGVTLYEDSLQQCEAADKAIQTLVGIVDAHRLHGCVFKLLATCHWTSRVLYKRFHEKEILYLSDNIEAAVDFTNFDWQLGAGQLGFIKRLNFVQRR